MSEQTEQELQEEIVIAHCRVVKLKTALKVIQEKKREELPLAFMAEYNGHNRLVMRITAGVRRAVNLGSEYIALCPGDGTCGMPACSEAYIRSKYTIGRTIFE